MFPLNTGNPLGEDHGGATYFMFEVHYDNPQLRSCKKSRNNYSIFFRNFMSIIVYDFVVVDSSGFRLFYTDRLRKFDSAALLVGQ